MASIKKFYTRSELGMRSPRSVNRNITPRNGGVAVHYGGPAQKITSQKRAREVWRSWQNYHMNHHGWVDIAYTAGFDNWGNVYAGRGYGVRTAANGTNTGNQNYVAFVWLGGGNEQPSDAALDALNWLIQDARRNGAGNAVKPHSFFKSTSCPGNLLRQRVAQLDGKSSLPGSGGSSTRDYITVGDKGAEVRSWQNDLLKWNSSALPRFGADSDFGGETAEWTVRFYDEVGLRVGDRSAPLVGKVSREAMKKALATPPPQEKPLERGEVPNDRNFTTADQVRERVAAIRANRGLNPDPASDEIWVDRIAEKGSHNIGHARVALTKAAIAKIRTDADLEADEKSDEIWVARIVDDESHTLDDARKAIEEKAEGKVRDKVAAIRKEAGLDADEESDNIWVTRIVAGTHTIDDAKKAIEGKASSQQSAEQVDETLPEEDLQQNDSGTSVEQWQKALKRWRHKALSTYGIDGIFGPETRDWTRRFQSAAGVVVDGIVDAQTRRAMLQKLKR